MSVHGEHHRICNFITRKSLLAVFRVAGPWASAKQPLGQWREAGMEQDRGDADGRQYCVCMGERGLSGMWRCVWVWEEERLISPLCVHGSLYPARAAGMFGELVRMRG